MRSNLHPGQVGEGRLVGAHDRPSRGPRGGGDDQVVRTTGPALAPYVDEELGVDLGHRLVVVENGNHLQEVFEEGEAGSPVVAGRKHDPDPQLGHRDRGDRDVVVVSDGLVEGGTRAIGVDQEGRVEEELAQGRCSSSTADRTSDRS